MVGSVWFGLVSGQGLFLTFVSLLFFPSCDSRSVDRGFDAGDDNQDLVENFPNALPMITGIDNYNLDGEVGGD